MSCEWTCASTQNLMNGRRGIKRGVLMATHPTSPFHVSDPPPDRTTWSEPLSSRTETNDRCVNENVMKVNKIAHILRVNTTIRPHT